MKALTKTVVLLLLFASISGTACGPKVPRRTVTPSDSTGGTPPDTLQQSAQYKKKPIRKLRPAPIGNDSTGGTPSDTLMVIPKRDSL